MVSKGQFIRDKIKSIKGKIQGLIEAGEFSEARFYIKEYKKVIPDDVDLYSMNAVMAMMEAKYDEAEELLLNGLSIDNRNCDLLYNLGYLYETKGLYLKSLEEYEKMVFNMKDTPERVEMIQYIRNLENKHREIIQRMLENSKKYNSKKTFHNKINLHLLNDSQYCDKFIHFANKHFPNKENQFVIIGNKDKKLKLMNVNHIKNVTVIDLKYDLKKLLDYLDNCSKIFIHYLYDYICELVCKYNIKKPLYWIMWGGDFYNYIDIKMYDSMTKELLKKSGFKINHNVNKDSLIYLYRKATIRKIDYILMSDDLEYNMLKEIFITNAKYEKIMYPSPVNLNHEKLLIKNEKYNLKKKYKYVVLIGNSANPSNNQLDIIYKLKNIKSKEFCVVVPLSYGGPQTYVNQLILSGKKILGERFIPITEYLEADVYKYLLSQVDVAIFNHNRAQARGNIRSLLLLGKKVYVKHSTTTYDSFRQYGLKIYSIDTMRNLEDIDKFIYISESDKNINEKLIINLFGLEECKKVIENIL